MQGRTVTTILRYGALTAAVILILLVNVLRFIGLDKSPPGFHVDELSGAVTVQCLEQEGVDAVGTPYPLFANLKYGSPKPPTYLYPAILWTRVFGHSIASYRAFSALITVLSLLALFMVAARLFDRETAVWCMLLGSLSPTVFQISRVGLEPGLAPLFLLGGIYFYWGKPRLWESAVSGALFAAAMYSYPPARLFVPVFVVLLVATRWGQGQRGFAHPAVMAASLCVVNIPLVRGTLSGEYMGRFEKIGIFSPEFWADQGKPGSMTDVAGIFWHNFAAHLSPDYLFVHGDENLVYSTGRFGLLGWADVLALVCAGIILVVAAARLIRGSVRFDQERTATALLFAGSILLAIVPAALTWQDIPHSLRMILYWPFLALLGGWSLATASRRVPASGLAFVTVAGLFAAVYFPHYFHVYPERSYYMFNGFTKDEALAAKSQTDWLKFLYRYRRQDYHARYYMMNYMDGQTCSSSQKVWKEVHKIP